MDMSGERLIAAPKEKVWSALNDLKILKACISGCESIEKLSETELSAIAAVILGPIAARFTGKIRLSEVSPPNSCSISCEGQGGAAGTAKGGGQITLVDESGNTRLAYKAEALTEGKIAQLDPALLYSSFQQMAEDFLTKFSALVAPPGTSTKVVSDGQSPYHGLAEDHDHDPSNPHYFGLPIGVIIAATIATISVGLTLYKYIHIG